MFLGRRLSFRAWIVPACLLLIHACLLVASSLLQFPTRNEVAHVPAGLTYWRTGNFSLYNVNPPLGKMLATLPTLFLNPNTDGIESSTIPGKRLEWAAAQRFAEANSANYFQIMWSARLAGILWSVLGGIVVYRWATELYTSRGGLLVLALWCFEPNVIAHSQLATPDTPATVMGVTATYVFWKYLNAGTWKWATFAGIALGIAQLTKFTMLVLYAVWPVLAVILWWGNANSPASRLNVRTRAAQGALIALLSVWLINVGYGFEDVLIPLGRYEFVSSSLAGRGTVWEDANSTPISGNRFRGTMLGSLPVPLPYDYLSGLDIQRRDLEGTGMQPSFLAGEWRQGGWWYYYLYGLLVKVPTGTLILALWSLLLTFTKSPQSANWRDELTLWLPAVVMLILTSSQTGFSHHFRYVLPIAPFVFIATGKLAGLVRFSTRKAGFAVLLLLGWSTLSSLAVYPHSLSYFNEFAGGPDSGYKHLADSNIDWGQDVYFFKSWADRHQEARPLNVAFNSAVSLKVVGLNYEPIGPHLRPGWYAVDLWNLTRQNGRFTYFRKFQPVARAGYSIYLYHLTSEDCDRLREEAGPPRA